MMPVRNYPCVTTRVSKKLMVKSEIKEPIGMYGARLEAGFHALTSDKPLLFVMYGRRCVRSSGMELSGLTSEHFGFFKMLF